MTALFCLQELDFPLAASLQTTYISGLPCMERASDAYKRGIGLNPLRNATSLQNRSANLPAVQLHKSCIHICVTICGIMQLAEVLCCYFVLMTDVKRLMKDLIVKVMVRIIVGY